MLLFPSIFVNTIFIPLNPFGSINSFCTHSPYLPYEKHSQTYKIHRFWWLVSLSPKLFLTWAWGRLPCLGQILLKATLASAQDTFPTFCLSVPLRRAHRPSSHACSTLESTHTDRGLGPSGWVAAGLWTNKGFRSPWLSLPHLLPGSNPLTQMTAAGPAPIGWCHCRMFQPERNPFCQADCQGRLEEVPRLYRPSQRQDRERRNSGRGLSSVPH